MLYNTGSALTGTAYGGHFINSNITSGSSPYIYGAYGAANGTETSSSSYHYGLAAAASGAYNNVALSAVSTGSSGGTRTYGGYFNASSSSITYGVYSTTSGASSDNYGIYSTVSGSATFNYGVYSTVGTCANPYGGYFYANYATTGNTSYGIYAQVGTSAVSTSYAGYFVGDVYTTGGAHSMTGYLVASDQMFKTNVNAITNPSVILNKLKPRSYYYDTTANNGTHFSGKKQYGFIAQELQQVLPELVYNSTQQAQLDSAGNVIHAAIPHLAVNYDGFIALLTAGMQTQQGKIDSLVTKTTHQDSINQALQNQINQIVNNCCNSTNRNLQQGNGINNNGGINGSSPTNTTSIGGTNTTNGGAVSNIELASNSAIIYQNIPHPFGDGTMVKYFVPENTTNAQIVFYDQFGSQLNTFNINQTGAGQINVASTNLAPGTYSYSLIINGKVVDTKRMIKTTN